MKFSLKGLESARKVRLKIVEWMETFAADSVSAVPHPHGETDAAIISAAEEFTRAMNADLNTPAALASVFTLMHHYYALRMKKAPLYKEDVRQLRDFLETVRKTFGCFEAVSSDLPAEVIALISVREQARLQKDFKESDRLREEIKKCGYEVRDADGKQIVKKL